MQETVEKSLEERWSDYLNSCKLDEFLLHLEKKYFNGVIEQNNVNWETFLTSRRELLGLPNSDGYLITDEFLNFLLEEGILSHTRNKNYEIAHKIFTGIEFVGPKSEDSFLVGMIYYFTDLSEAKKYKEAYQKLTREKVEIYMPMLKG